VNPYYQDSYVTIYHGDCREILPTLPDNSVDLVLTDPPYNVGIDYGEGVNDKLSRKEYQRQIEGFVSITRALSGGKLCLVLGSKPLLDWWQFIPEAKLIVVKMGAISNNKIKGLTLQYHPLLTTVPSNTYMSDLWEDIRWPGEGYYFNEPRFGHPAMTPEKLARRCVSIFTEGPSAAVLDPFLGSGTVAVASKLLNRKCIGIEIEEKYCEIAANRCRQSVMELNL
jgi:site-specific DNA-methyltransferase (adenine-specific)